MQNVAWWVSTIHRDNRFLPQDIPAPLLPREIRGNRDSTTAVREALVGSVAEHVSHSKSSGLVGKKGANYYYFPHKSYIEFLVSQYFCRNDFSKEMYRTFFAFANPEMISFVEEGPNVGAQNIAKGLEYVLGNVPKQIIRVAAKSEVFERTIQNRNFAKLSIHETYLAYEYFCSREQFSEVENLLLTSINNARSQKAALTALRLCGDYLMHFRPGDFALKLVANAFMGLNPVDLTNLLESFDRNSYLNSISVNRYILGKCVERVSTEVWRLHPSFLVVGGTETFQQGMWCDGYGWTEGTKGEVTPLRIERAGIVVLLDRPEYKSKLLLLSDFSSIKNAPR